MSRAESPDESNPTGADEFRNMAEMDGSDPESKLDIVFLQDTTGSQGPYIKHAKRTIENICIKVSTKTNTRAENIRFGLIAFRNHPPKETTYVTLKFDFTSDVQEMQTRFEQLTAQGRWDGPKAVTAAMAGALNMPWDPEAGKLVMLITDAPPHGIGEEGDPFDHSPDQNDPLELAQQMAEEGIVLFVVACEPTLSQTYRYALSFYQAITELTGGEVLALDKVNELET